MYKDYEKTFLDKEVPSNIRPQSQMDMTFQCSCSDCTDDKSVYM